MKKLFVVGLVMFLGGVGAFAILLQMVNKNDFKNAKNYLNKYSNLSEEDAVDFGFDEKFTFTNAQELKLDVVFGDIEISESKDNDLHVTLNSRIHKDLKPFDHKKIVYQEGNQVHINLMDLFNDKNSTNNFIKVNDQSITISNALRLKISIPHNYKVFKIETISADYVIKNISLDQLHINNVSGDFKLDQVKALTAKINTVSGDLEFNGLQFENVKLDTVSGDAVFRFKSPADLAAEITSVSGDLEGDSYFEKHISEGKLKLGEPKHKISINSVSGDVEFLKQ
jgi:DUF4097 and DUF4098 domain-containing protein YvlB